MNNKQWSAVSIGFGILVITIVCALTFNDETLTHILSFNILFLGLAILFRLIALGFWGGRIVCMAGSLHYKVGFWYSVNMVLAGLFAGTFTPGQLGGEAVRIHELYKSNVTVGDATAIVIVERVLDGVVLTILGIITLLMLQGIWKSFPTSVMIIMGIAWVFMLSILLIPFIAIRYPVQARQQILRLIDWVAGRFPGERMSHLRERAEPELDNLFRSITLFTGPARSGLITGGLCTLAFWITEFMVASVILMGLGYPPSIAESFFFQIVIAIVMMIPSTPGSTGVTEIATTSLYSLLIPVSVVGIFVLIWRFITFYLNLLLGAGASIHICRRELAQKECLDSCMEELSKIKPPKPES